MALKNDPNYDSSGDIPMAAQPQTAQQSGLPVADMASGAVAGYSIGSGFGGALGGYLGRKKAQGDFDAANAAYEQALQEANALNVPELEKMQFIGERQASIMQDKEAGPSRMEGVSTDPEFLRAQMEVLQGLREQGRTGLTAEDKAAFNELRKKNLRDQQAQQQSVMSRAQERGATPGSGVELAMQQAAQQQGAEEQAAGSHRLAAMAAQRAAQAKGQYGEMAGSLRNQEFGEKSKVAEAADVAKRFDVANSLATQKFNISNEVAREAREAQAKRDVQRYNVAELPTNQFNMQSVQNAQLQKALQARGGQRQQQGQNIVQGETQFWQGIGGGIGGLGGMAAGSMSDSAKGASQAAPMVLAGSDEKLKKNVKAANKEIESFLDNLKALKYSYKDPEVDGEGEHFSPMAQDLEKSKPGKAMIEDTSRGKYVDYAKGFGTMTAALANLNKRLRDLEKK